MIHKCAVGGCPNNSDTIIHYTLPEESNRRRQWVQFMQKGGKGLDVSVSSRICGSHFSEDSFSKLDLGFTTRLILKVNAVPTIYPEEFMGGKRQPDDSTLENGTARRVNGSETISPDEMHEDLVDHELTEGPFEFELPGEPDDQIHDEPFNIIKVEPQEDDGYSGSQLEPISEYGDFNSGPDITNKPSQHQFSINGGLFHCVYCGKGYVKESMLKRHELKHKTVNVNPFLKQYRCHQCGKDFSHKAFLKAHQKVHATMESQMAFGCDKCDRRFRKKSGLRRHMQNHLERGNYPCPVCDEEFEMKGSLHNHVKSHPGERFPCKYCNQRFLKFDAYIKHVEKHTVVTPYYCEICKVYQLTERGFRLHQKGHARADQQTELANTKQVEVKMGRPLKKLSPIENLLNQLKAEPQADSNVFEPDLNAQSVDDTDGTALLDASGEDLVHNTTGPSDDAEMEEEEEEVEVEEEEEVEVEEEEEDEEMTPEDEVEEASDGSLEESTPDDHETGES